MSSENLVEPWTPNVVCNSCRICLFRWMAGEKYGYIIFCVKSHTFFYKFVFLFSCFLSFDSPAIWRQPYFHDLDCYFCLTTVNQHGRHRTVEYVNVEVHSMTKPVLHSLSVPYPVCPKRTEELHDTSDSTEFTESDVDLEKIPKLYTQCELNDMIRDLDLSKENSEILASRLQERNMLTSDVRVTYYRKR